MTRKDYVKFAKVIKSEVDGLDKGNACYKDIAFSITSIADGMSAVFREDNLNYDRNRFLDACGL